MRSFFIRSILFVFPIILVILPMELWLAISGESIKLDEVHQIQLEKRDALFMRGILSQDYNTYKSIGIQRNNPDILILGSSRVMQFREIMFNDDYGFYNAGGILQCSEDLIAFVNLMNEGVYRIPKIVIIGIDPWWLKKDGRPKKSWLTNQKLLDHSKEPSAHLGAFKKVIFGFNKYKKSRLYRQNIGLNAQITGGGFRYDGSKAPDMETVQNFESISLFVDRENPPVKDRIKKRITNRFTVSDPDTSRYMLMEKALLALQKKCRLIIYMPPFTDESFLLLDQSDSLKDWWLFYTSYISERMKKKFRYTIEVHSPASYHLSDVYFFDGFHPSEVFVGHQLSSFFKDNPELDNYASPRIDQMLAKAYNPLFFFENGK